MEHLEDTTRLNYEWNRALTCGFAAVIPISSNCLVKVLVRGPKLMRFNGRHRMKPSNTRLVVRDAVDVTSSAENVL